MPAISNYNVLLFVMINTLKCIAENIVLYCILQLVSTVIVSGHFS